MNSSTTDDTLYEGVQRGEVELAGAGGLTMAIRLDGVLDGIGLNYSAEESEQEAVDNGNLDDGATGGAAGLSLGAGLGLALGGLTTLAIIAVILVVCLK